MPVVELILVILLSKPEFLMNDCRVEQMHGRTSGKCRAGGVSLFLSEAWFGWAITHSLYTHIIHGRSLHLVTSHRAHGCVENVEAYEPIIFPLRWSYLYITFEREQKVQVGWNESHPASKGSRIRIMEYMPEHDTSHGERRKRYRGSSLAHFHTPQI